MAHDFTLNTNTTIPAIGFGTWEITPSAAAAEAVSEALSFGYRHIDTARIYGNEAGVGDAIADSGIMREEIFVTTKLWNDDHAYEDALVAIDASLDRLGMDYVDLYLVHWPQSGLRDEAWRAMQDIHASGKAKAVGVSNYTTRHLEELLAQSSLVPAVNQVEFHPFIYAQQKELLAYCQDKGILVEAYSPLSRLSGKPHPVVDQIAERVGRTSSQVVLRWCLQHGTVPLPRSTNPDHIRENIQIFDFELSDEDMQALNAMSDGERVTYDPEQHA